MEDGGHEGECLLPLLLLLLLPLLLLLLLLLLVKGKSQGPVQMEN